MIEHTTNHFYQEARYSQKTLAADIVRKNQAGNYRELRVRKSPKHEDYLFFAFSAFQNSDIMNKNEVSLTKE